MPDISENSCDLSISTVIRQSREWRLTVLVELYFNTLGELIHSAAGLFVSCLFNNALGDA
jgi:hypothetical protein